MPNNWTGAYLPDSRGFVLDFELPSIERFPTLLEVKFVTTRSEFTEKHMTEKNATKLYDDFLYQVALRTIHELFESDVANAIDFVVFNGFVNSINKATGQEQSACIATVQVDKTTFLALNLSAIDPKTCFKQLKGVSASTLSSLTPVAPLMRMDTSDKRFVDGKDVAQSINDSTNLAAMNWEDFEHLVRELFAKEFANNGSEVRVTRASRDGGVDAIAFDPDPIRGGKIVIQAKRYTNLVDVSAVRDLYGTVMNEGATKGILVTTSDFGPDAYAFATGKPISLLNGANLLHLLEKHGKRAYIDVKEAKILNAQQS
jgi:restriction system protein